MGNLSSKHVIPSKMRQDVANNNAYNFRNDTPTNPQFASIDSSLWPKPKRPPELRLFDPSVSNQVSEVSDFLGKTTTLVDLSDTSTLTVSSDEISSRSSSDTLHTTQPSIRNQPSVDKKQVCRSGSGDVGDKSIANSDYLNLESLSTPTGCSRFQPKQISKALDDNLPADVPHKLPNRKELKPPAQPKPFPPPSAPRQPLSNFKSTRSLSRLSVTPGLRPRPLNDSVSDPKLPDRQPQKAPQASLRKSLSQSAASLRQPVPNKPSQYVPRHIKQIENHNSQQTHHYRGGSSGIAAYPFLSNDSRNFNSMSDIGGMKNASLSNMSINLSSASQYLRQSYPKGFKKHSNLKPILLSPKDSSQSYVASCALNPKSSKPSLRSPITPKSPKVEHGHKPKKTHGLRKISDTEYQKYNAIINDFHYYMRTRTNPERRDLSCPNSRSPSVESKNSSIDNPKSNKAYDETDDEIYSFPVSTTQVRPPSQMERVQSAGAFGDSRHDVSSWSNKIKSVVSSGRTQKHPTIGHRSVSLPRNSAHSYVVEIDGNITELRRRAKDPKAIFCYKFPVSDGIFMQKMLADTKDHRIETICRQTSCRIHVKRRWLRHSSQPPSYDIIIFAREIKHIERCCNLFNIMFPSFNADAGLGY